MKKYDVTVDTYNGDKIVTFYKPGTKEYHRLDGPAYIYYNKDSSIGSESYYIDNKLHRLDGPAYISYYEGGSVCGGSYSVNGNFHRLDGPAFISYNKDGSVSIEDYYVDGKRCTKEEFLKSTSLLQSSL